MKRSFVSKSRGFTLVELLVVIAIIGVLAGLLLPAVQQAREAGRRMSCGNNIRQLMLAAEMFSGTYKKFPTGVHPLVSGQAVGENSPLVQVSGITLMLPFLEQGTLYNSYNQKRDWFDATPLSSTTLTAMPPNALTFDNNYNISTTKLSLLNCPSSIDPNRRDGNPQNLAYISAPTTASVPVTNAIGWTEQFAVTDYSALLGVNPRLLVANNSGLSNSLVDQAGHGALTQAVTARDSDVRDGKSNTIFFAESAGRPFVFNKNRQSGTVISNRTSGGAWAKPSSDFWVDGSLLIPASNGQWTPNFLVDGCTCAINCTNGQDVGTGNYPTTYASSALTSSISTPLIVRPGTATALNSKNRGTHMEPGTVGTGEVYSFHTGGVNVVFGDNSVKFISQNIDIREFAKLVTRDAGEVIADLPE